jgi:hypothetical protein
LSKFWEILETEHGAIIKPKGELHCPICGETLLLHDFRSSYSERYGFYHCDTHLKCLHCSFFLTFGVPVTKEENEVLSNSQLNGKILTSKHPSQEEIRERLKLLGYW